MIRESVHTDRLYWPHWVFISPRVVIPGGHGLGAAYGPFIVLQTGAAQYLGVLVHEQQHVRQWWYFTLITYPILWGLIMLLGGGINPIVVLYFDWLLYRLAMRSRPVKSWAEIDAHRRELRLYGYPEDMARSMSHSIHAAYELGLEPNEIYTRLVKGTPLQVVQKI